MCADRPSAERRKGLSGLTQIQILIKKSQIPSGFSVESPLAGCFQRDPLINSQNFIKFGSDLPFDKNGELVVHLATPGSRYREQKAISVPELRANFKLGTDKGQYREADLLLVYLCAEQVLVHKKHVSRIVCLSDSVLVDDKPKLVVATRVVDKGTVQFALDTDWENQVWDHGSYFALVKNIKH